MRTKINKELLFQYFAGNATPLEKARIDEWVQTEENEEQFYFLLDEWECDNLQYVANRDHVFSKFEKQLQSNLGKNPKSKSFQLPRYFKFWMAIAGAILFVICTFFIAKDTILYKTHYTQYGETMTLMLDDNSQVVLNANSQLKVPRWIDFSTDREVWLEGEAFFKVSKKKNRKKFYVHTPDLKIEVLGTRFNVTSRHKATKVVLQEGEVKVTSNSDEGNQALLKESGDYAEVRNKDKSITTKKVDESLYTTWQEKRLKFESTDVKSVLQTIEDYYGVQISAIDSSVVLRKFSGTLPNNDLEVILRALSNIYNTDFSTNKIINQKVETNNN